MFSTTDTIQIPMLAFRQAIKFANDAGRFGRKVNVLWVPPQSASQDPIGFFIVDDITPNSASEEW